jgi:hypothetical protein
MQVNVPRVNLRDNQRHARVHAKRAAVINDDATALPALNKAITTPFNESLVNS